MVYITNILQKHAVDAIDAYEKDCVLNMNYFQLVIEVYHICEVFSTIN